MLQTRSRILRLLLVLSVLLTCQGCPDRCWCSSQTVRCQNLDLDSVPQSLPSDTQILFLTGANISALSLDSFPQILDQLTDLYLGGNQLDSVGPKAFDHLPNLLRLDLSENQLQTFSDRAFPEDSKLQVLNLSRSFLDHSSVDQVLGLLQTGNLLLLQVLDLSNNDLVILPDDSFRNLPNLVHLSLQNCSIVSIQNGTLKTPPLQNLDLRDNSLKTLETPTLTELRLRPELQVWLAGNPWLCDCLLEEMLCWLKNSSQVLDVQNLSCSDPEALRHQPLLQVALPHLNCSTHLEGVLETSYVFLGLVLALIGVIFLLVLYLNRKGIKRWIYNIRDACRDHMEGYHYRYEINSNPRLANLSVNSHV